MDLTKAEARALVEKLVCVPSESLPPEDEIIILDEATIDKPWGWVFFHTSRLWHESGDIRYALAGNAPLIVEKATGRIIPTGTAHRVADYIDNYERTGSPCS